jgi:hypothetical protein
MPRRTIKRYPGRPDINAQYSKKNLEKTLTLYKKIRAKGGDYQFGELTALFYGLNASEKQAWEDDLKTYSKGVQDEIKRHIIHALTRVDHSGEESPVPLAIEWKTGSKAVTLTYDPSGPAYKIQIFGFPAPATTPFASRRAKYKES